MAIPERRILEDQLVAPCKPEGEVFTLDEETREGECNCSKFRCYVNSQNVVTQTIPQKETDLQPVK